jgi:hypothetical protein
MADMHLTRELLGAVARGEITGQLLDDLMLQHLRTLCPYCERELDDFALERAAAQRGDDPPPSLEALSAVLDRHLREDRRLQERARRNMKALLALPRDAQDASIQRSRTRFRGTQIVWLLLQESDAQVPASPEKAEHLAELARQIVLSSTAAIGGMDLLALTTAYLANACRAAGKRPAADRHFRYVRSLVSEEGVADTEILARIDHLEGSLRRDQERFKEAGNLLSRSVLLFSVAGEKVERTRALFTLGSTFFLQGELTQAIETTRTGLRSLPGAERSLYLRGRYNLARFLAEAGDHPEAAGILAEDEELHRELPEPWMHPRRVWLRGKIDAGRGDAASAEQHFLAARAGFLDQRNACDAALVSLEDLAALYLRQGRTAEVQPLAEELAGVFQEQNLPDDALRALRLCAAAAQREELTAVLVRHSAARIRQAFAERATQE